MVWSSPDSWLTRLFSGDPLAILVSLIVTISLPAILHWYFYTQSQQVSHTPTILLLGPSGSGKTSLISLLQRRVLPISTETSITAPSQTRTSQVSSTASLLLPSSIPLGSNKYRSENDFEVADAKSRAIKYNIIDTPGHGKLRSEHALVKLDTPGLRGVIFMVDSAVMDAADGATNEDASRDASVYLHDLLLALQKRRMKDKIKADFNVLIAANKQDLFTALPPGAIKSKLQDEIEKVRKSRSKGIKTMDRSQDADDDEDEILGGAGEDKFGFKIMEEEYAVVVEIAGGAVRGEEAGKGIKSWEEWIGGCL